MSGEELAADMKSQSWRFNTDQLPYFMEQQQFNEVDKIHYLQKLTVNRMSQSCRVNSGSTEMVLSRNSSSKYTAIVDTDEREDKAVREEVTKVPEVIDKLKEVVEDLDTEDTEGWVTVIQRQK